MSKQKNHCGHHNCGCDHHHECGCNHHHECSCKNPDISDGYIDCECECHDAEQHACGCGCNHAHEAAPKQRIATPGFQPQSPEKGVSLGADLEREIADEMRKRYKRFLDDDEIFTVKTEVCHQFGLVSSTMTNKARTICATAEVSVECEDNKIENPMDAYEKALDVLDLVWLDYFDSDRIAHYLPIWQGYEIDSMTVNVRFEHNNPSLDDEASAFLKAHGLLENGLSPDDYLDDDEVSEDDDE